MIKTCVNCKKEFKTPSSKRKFCSKECYRNYMIGRKRNIDIAGSKNPNYKGGRRADKDGYILVMEPTHPDRRYHGYVLEHRLFVEQYLKLRLTKNDIVHHKNGIRSDNRLINLDLLSKSDHDNLHNATRNKSKRIIKTCPVCNKKFSSLKSSGVTYCSLDCFFSLHRLKRVCPYCGKVFTTRKVQPRIFCSKTCCLEMRKETGLRTFRPLEEVN